MHITVDHDPNITIKKNGRPEGVHRAAAGPAIYASETDALLAKASVQQPKDPAIPYNKHRPKRTNRSGEKKDPMTQHIQPCKGGTEWT